MIGKSWKLSKKYALDILILHPIRNIRDGLTGAEFKINCDWFKADHNPQFRIILILCNITIFEITFYNINHVQN